LTLAASTPGENTAATTQFTEAVSSIVDAFGDPTRRSIYLYVQGQDGASASDVAAHFALHPNVARHHLDKLVLGGYLEFDIAKMSSAKAGRPSKVYRASKKRSLFDRERKQFELLSMLLSRTLEALPQEVAERLSEEVGVEYGKTIAKELPNHPYSNEDLREIVGAIAEALSAHGFSSEGEARATHLRVINNSCPFGSTAVDHPVLCAVDRGIIKGMLGALYDEPRPLTLRSKARGDVDCSVAL
jgi:predicted ArsR family transcriptional regulator